MTRIIECVPNFSEGRDRAKIESIATAIGSVGGVRVLNIDVGESANRTVITFAGEPEAVVEAAFRGVKRASELIDMRTHHGEHPRIGATDVLPIVPVAGVTLEEAADMARALAARIGHELGIPIYCYETAAFSPQRVNLASCRAGEYEGLADKMAQKEWTPDFGSREFTPLVARTGLSVVGARDFLVAVNFNLDTSSEEVARAIAADIRAARRAGSIDGIKAIGWYIEEFGFAQVSTNLTDIAKMPLHKAWRIVRAAAERRGAQVTGTEIIGLVPRQVLVEAGKFFAPQTDNKLTDNELIALSVERLGLSTIKTFDPDRRILENLL